MPALPPSISSHHALLVSYSRVGSLIGTRLLQADVPMVVVENIRASVDALRDQGINAVLGNAARAETMAREQNLDLTIIVCAHYDDEMDYIAELGATQVVMGEREIANNMIALLQREMEQTPL